MKERPITTLFMLMSVDGKISTGSTDNMDIDKDFPVLPDISEGLHQYYEIEQTTDLWSLNSGRTQAKIGVNEAEMPPKTEVSFVVMDNHHLAEHGIRYFCALSKDFVLVTSNRSHPAFDVQENNLHILYQETADPHKMLTDLKQQFGCEKITIQTGGTLNGLFLREKLIDRVDIIVAPVLIGGRDTSTLVDGESLTSVSELGKLGIMELVDCETLQNSYIRLRYKVMK
ncbi:MAG: dihydrofolate reductase family protein [Oscillospiraceae bacterium]|nr:dihydrofolate reductase family protein [Oscillospiraceae bacterium]